METSDTLPDGWRWEDRSNIAYPLTPVVLVLKGKYPNRGHHVCVFQHSNGWFYVRRHGGIRRTYEVTLTPDDIPCTTLEEAKAVGLAMVRLIDEGHTS